MMHWAEAYIGLPWVKGAEGPHAYSCWGLVRAVQQRHYGRALPQIVVDEDDDLAIFRAFRDHAERMRWREASLPQDGCLVDLGCGTRPHHVGVWLDVDGGGCLHSVKGAGVVFSDRSRLAIDGWGYVAFWVPA